MEKHQLVERSIIKKFQKTIWRRFTHALSDYQLIQPGDRIAACISGGKDSMLMAKCLQEIQRHGNVPFELEFMVMDPGYSEPNRQLIERNAQLLSLPIRVFEAHIFNYVAKVDASPCYLCARMRRGHLYKNAQALGCNKIALGHHFDDAIETMLMSILYGSEVKTMLPKLKSTSHPGMQLIRPLYLVRERDILAWKTYNGLEFLQCACRFTENIAQAGRASESKRQEMKQLIRQLREMNPNADINLFNSMHNVNLDAMCGYTQEGVKHSFLERFDSD